jgi:hypothetical protein
MDYRALTVSAVLATGVVGVAPICRADIVASEDGIAVRDAGVAAPARGMTMAQVASKFGDPVTKVPAVGKPPISRWEYSGFVVYFERDRVLHAVVSASAPMESSGAALPPAAAPAPAPEPAPAAVPVRTTAPPASVTPAAAPMQPPPASSSAPVPGASADSEAPPQP